MSEYPVGSKAKKYFDQENMERGLYWMVRNEPNWAKSRIIEGEKALDRIATLEGFARELLKLSDFRDDIDGGDFQDIAIKYGILKGVEVTEPCSPLCNCAEYFGSDDFPQTCYRSTLPEEQAE